MTKNMLIWWFFCCLQVFAAIIGYHKGFFSYLAVADVTYISFFILIAHTVAFAILGYYTWKKDKSCDESLWYVSDAQLGLGMAGTLVGFIIMFREAFGSNISVENLKNIIDAIATGLGTANWTTLIGLLSALILKALLVNLESIKDEQK